MSEGKPKISIIIPIYNAEQYLRKCLDSVVNQTLRDIEIICIDDGSSDNCAKICKEYADKDERITFVSTENRGPSAARNTGLRLAVGDFLGFIDSDDWIDLEFYEKLYNAVVETNSEIAIASIIRKREHKQKYRSHYKKQEIFERLQEKINICNIPKTCYMVNKIYKRESFTENKLSFKEGVFYEDVRLLIKVICFLGRLVTVPGVNYYYRVNKKSIVKTRPSVKKLEDHYEALVELFKFADLHNIKTSDKEHNITKSKKYFMNILWLKVKQHYNSETFYLFGFIPFLTISRYNTKEGEKCQK